MRTLTVVSSFLLLSAATAFTAQTPSPAPLRLGIVGLVHGHVDGFFKRALKRTDVEIVGIAEPDRTLFERYAAQYKLSNALYFPSLEAMIEQTHPIAVLAYTNTFDHRSVVEKCSPRGVHVMMEKPLAVSYTDALAIAHAARAGNIHVLVNYETTWYASNKAAHDLVQEGGLGDLRKVVVHDGHEGPKEIHVPPEFFAWLTNPRLNGAGALYDFGCYGADLVTWLMKGRAPATVTAVTQHIKPEIYPNVDDEADVILTYPDSIAILQGSWNWPFARKDMEVYGRTGYAKTVLQDNLEVRREGEKESHLIRATPLTAPYDDSLHFFAGVLSGAVRDDQSLSSLNTNVVVTEILDAARQSAASAKTVTLPLPQ